MTPDQFKDLMILLNYMSRSADWFYLFAALGIWVNVIVNYKTGR